MDRDNLDRVIIIRETNLIPGIVINVLVSQCPGRIPAKIVTGSVEFIIMTPPFPRVYYLTVIYLRRFVNSNIIII